jgi:molybdopterin-containing oxidoreductase family iron-sulfur binding subunit
MVIDLHRCTGCAACIIGCKNENNLTEGVAWSNKITRTVGKFPNVRYDYIPTLCNHCANAPCVAACPTEAMYKAEGGITMIDVDKCIGCRYCMAACPYGVIHFNAEEPHPRWQEETVLIPEGTTSPIELTEKVGGTVIPYYNPDRAETMPGIRPQGVVEKCTFCDHRIKNGELPYCVEVCPASARIFGDLGDPESDVSGLLGRYMSQRLREDLGTEPKVHYIRSFQPGGYEKTKGDV